MNYGAWTKTGLALVLLFLLYRAFTQLRNNKELLNKANFKQSLITMGIIGVLLIGFIYFLVTLLNLR